MPISFGMLDAGQQASQQSQDQPQQGINTALLNAQPQQAHITQLAAPPPTPTATDGGGSGSLLDGLSKLVKGIHGAMTGGAQASVSPDSVQNALNNQQGQGSRTNQDIGSTLLGNAQQQMGLTAASSILKNYLQKANPGLDPSTTPWCAGFVGSVLNASGIQGTGSLAAKSYLKFGTPTDKPQNGDLVVFNDLTGHNDPAHGHVGFYAGTDKNGNIMTVGGNEGGQVAMKAYPANMVAGFRIPPSGQQVKQFAQQQGVQSPQQLSQIPQQVNQQAQQSQLSVQNIVQQAKLAYPNNPNMQKLVSAQALQESGIGSGKPSQLAQKNNLFGIKGSGTAGSVVMPTTEYMNGQPRRIPAGFATNHSVADSFAQHQHVMGLPRYDKVQSAKSFEDAAREVQKAGYATDPNYSKNLINVYNSQLAPYFQGTDGKMGPSSQNDVQKFNTNATTPPIINNQQYEDMVRTLDQGHDDYSQNNNSLNQLLG